MEFGILIPLAAIVLPLMIPIVAILSQHQRKMAELMARRSDPGPLVAEIQALRQEVSALRQRMDEQTIQLDNLASLGARTAPALADRLDAGVGR